MEGFTYSMLHWCVTVKTLFHSEGKSGECNYVEVEDFLVSHLQVSYATANHSNQDTFWAWFEYIWTILLLIPDGYAKLQKTLQKPKSQWSADLKTYSNRRPSRFAPGKNKKYAHVTRSMCQVFWMLDKIAKASKSSTFTGPPPRGQVANFVRLSR